MQQLRTLFCLLCLAIQHSIATTGNFIGFDGKARRYPANKDGIHISSLQGHHAHHMLNKQPIIVSKRNLHITSPTSHINHHGLGNSAEAPIEFDEAVTNQQKRSFRIRGPSHIVQFQGGHEENLKDLAGASPASAQAVASSAGSAPGPAPGQPPGLGADAAYAMDEDVGAPEQGFKGQIVEHDNMKTMTEDWHGEYGPNASGEHSYIKICAEYPDNTWCRNHGYHTPAPRSSANQAGGAVLSLILAAAALLA